MVIPNRTDNILSVFILDVGDGDSILIELPKVGSERKYIIVDCNKADKTLKFLNELNAEHLSLVVSTHPHRDHVRGLEDIVKEFDISNDKSVNII